MHHVHHARNETHPKAAPLYFTYLKQMTRHYRKKRKKAKKLKEQIQIQRYNANSRSLFKYLTHKLYA